MAKQPSPAVIGAVIAGTAISGLAVYGVLNREKAQQLGKTAYDTISAGASTAATKSSEAFKAVQSSASASYSSVSSSFNKGVSGLKSYVTPRKYRRVKSFPVVLTEEDMLDVAAGKKQRRLKDNNKGSPKKPTGQQGKAPIVLQVTAK